MKICVIGCGNHSTYVHGPSYKKYAALHNDTVLAACCDINAEAASQYAEAFGFARTYTDYRQMLDAEKPDVTGIIMPVELTETVTESVLAMGYACLVEKPPAMTADGAERLAQAQARYAKPLRVCFNRRFMPLVRALTEALARNGEPIQAIHYDMHRFKRGSEDFSTTAIHGVDLVKHVAGAVAAQDLSEIKYKAIAYDYQDIENDGQSGFNIFMNGSMTNGAVVRLAFLPMTACDREAISVYTNHFTYSAELPVTRHNPLGSLRIYERNQFAGEMTSADLTDGTAFFESNGFWYEIASFLDLMREGKENRDGIIGSTVQSVAVSEYIREKRKSYNIG